MMAPATLALVLPPQSECVMILTAISLYSAHGYQVLIVSVNDA